MTFVVDACVAVEYLLGTTLGKRVSETIEGATLIAPELLDVEVASVLRRAEMSGALDEERAAEALEDLSTWGVRRVSHRLLLREAWRYRHRVTAYDAVYLAAARLFDATVLTTDGPLSRAPGLNLVVQNVRHSK